MASVLRIRNKSIRWLAGCFLLCFLALATVASAEGVRAQTSATDEEVSAEVVIDGTALFRVRGTSAYPADKRAQAIAERIVKLAADPGFKREDLRIDESQPGLALVMAGSTQVMAVYAADAELEGVDARTLAATVVVRVGEALEAWRQDRRPETLVRNGLYAAGATLALWLGLWMGSRLMRRWRGFTEKHIGTKIHDVNVLGFRVFGAQQMWAVLTGVLNLIWFAAILGAIHVYLSTVLLLFPWTRGFAIDLIDLLVHPLRTIGLGFIAALPDLIFLAVLFVLVRYVLKLIKHFFDNVAVGQLTLADFEPEWALPTYRLVKVLLIAITAVVAYPYIPGSDSDAFKGMSLLLGVIVSLGSSSVIGNVIAGYTMTYRRVFKLGDRVRIGEHLGDVHEARLLVTHLRTLKNEIVAIPNSLILGGEVVNYSKLAGKEGLILHTTVGIGYETPWRQVEAMLLEAAARTPDLLREPPPFVMHQKLGDFCVEYEINAYCKDAHAMFRLYTELQRNILDVFNEYGVQIMTPAYEGDPVDPKIVPRGQWYAAPARPPDRPDEVSSASPQSGGDRT
ncbi:MAG: mechanosensitive ion channel family protein [Azoarcus sp.]|nr:mechanosensitive ion channel family protein [Azoarcus sp.]